MFKVGVNIEGAIESFSKTIKSGYLNEGEQVAEFKSKVEKYLNTTNVVLTNSCTSALTMALKLSNVGPGDEVVTTSMTCLASNTPILNLGGFPVWADIDKNTGCIDPSSVESCITEKTKAVICVNWAGNPCDLKKLMKICEDNKIKLIQDAAHSFGATIDDKCTSQYTDFTCFSFQAIKHLTTGDGGALVCKNNKDYTRAKSMKWFGLDRDSAKDDKGEWKGQRWELDVKEAGYKFHMNNIAASIGLANITDISQKIRIHRLNAREYSDHFKNFDKIEMLSIPKNAQSSNWVFTVLTKLDRGKRDQVLKILNDAGINAGLVHTPNHFYTCFEKSFKDLKNVEAFSNCQISLPCGWWLTKKDIKFISRYVIKVITDIA